MTTTSWLPDWTQKLPWMGNKKTDPSPAAKFLHEHMETVITFAIYYFAAMRSPGLTVAGSLAGLVVQVYMAKETELKDHQKIVIEITDEGNTTRNDMLRHAIPAAIGTFFPSLRIATDTAVGFSSGGLSTRKFVKFAGPYMNKFSMD